MLRILLFSLFIFSFASAAVIGPVVHEQDDFGDPMFDDFTYSISVDCDAQVIKVIVMNGTLDRVDKAQTFLKYVDFATPLISRGKTDENGRVDHELPGSIPLMRGLFILVIEKDGYRTKEVHFDIAGCLTNTSYRPPVPEPEPQPPPPSQDIEIKPPVVNESDYTNETNATDDTEATAAPESGVCLPAFLLLLIFKRQ